MNKHTPGPWRWVDLGAGCSPFDALELTGPKEWVLAAEIEGSCDDARGAFILCSSPANASLVAAAPDLLAACARLERHVLRWAEQSENRTGCPERSSDHVEIPLSVLNDWRDVARAALVKAEGQDCADMK